MNQRAIAKRNQLILLVDDNREILRMLNRLLELEGYSVAIAADGSSALALLEKHKPDLILMDIMMPNMDGYTACRAIKTDKATMRIPVIMLSALGYELNKELAKSVGADGYITKPFSRQELLNATSKFL